MADTQRRELLKPNKNDWIAMLKHAVTRLFLWLCLVIAPAVSLAVTLGDIRVKSFLNQPLDAEIALVGLEPGQHENLRLRIANDEHFDRLGLARTPILHDLNFDIVRSSGRWLVRARSIRPVAEPFLDFPLQMTWPGGQLIKQYTLLLDPPRQIRPARVSRTTRSTPVEAAPQTDAPSVDSYGPVQTGETLWPIANKLKPRGITTRQMAMALLRANPHAFIKNNINRLRAGAILSIPPLGFIQELDPQTARAQFAAQTQRRQAALATSPRSLPPTTTEVAESSAPATEQTPDASELAPQEASPGSADAPNDQLRIMTDDDKGKPEPGSDQDLQAQLLVTMEEIESNRLTTDAIESRLARLEAELSRVQQLVDLKDEQIAALQSEVASRDENIAAAPTTETPLPDESSTTLAPEGEEITIEETSPVIAEAKPAPVEITSIETDSPVSTQPSTRPWYEEYLWLIWISLALLALIALVLMFRRPAERSVAVDDSLAWAAAGAGTGAAATTWSDDNPAAATAADTHPDDNHDIPDSVLADLLEESRLASEDPDADAAAATTADIDDTHSWIKDRVDDTSAASRSESTADDDEIPSILTELDDQLTGSSTTEFSDAPKINLEPVDSDTEPESLVEDDTFTMSLDLARAYLEIGDQEGAEDMLKQALAGAKDPEHRRQIEELLRQIG